MPPEGLTNATVLAVANVVEVKRYGAQVWDRAYVQPVNQVLNPGDRLRTGRDSRALLRLSNLTDFPVGELTQLEVPREKEERAAIRLIKGIIYFFHRDHPHEFQVDTPTVSAVVRGTEFAVEVSDDGTSTFRLLDGELEITNSLGALRLERGQTAVAKPGEAPVRTAVIMAGLANTIQWCLYYPAVLNLEELNLTREEQRILSNSIAAYRQGDLVQALTTYPAGRAPGSPDEKVYRASLLLAVGKVTEAEKLLSPSSRADPASRVHSLAQALMTLIAAVRLETVPNGERTTMLSNDLATPWLAESYYEQSKSHFDRALQAARRATSIAPEFAFARAQLAELEFGAGRRDAMADAEAVLRLAPRHAQGVALRGFLLAAQNRIRAAEETFNQAIALDGALGNAWLGRGLCRIQRGNSKAGAEDLLVAATLEPQRALLRAYLGKAFARLGNDERANAELSLARQLDPNDPTSWLYSALLEQQQNRINKAIGDLEASQQRNDNRSLFRSRLLLDEDRAVRSANLASIYRDAGMTDVGIREGAKAVAYDYAGDSAHLFLSDSYNHLRDPTRFNLRYETVWFNELLLANLLAPIGAGRLSQHVSQQEYSRLFDSEGLGFANTTIARSDSSYTELASQFGTFRTTSYSLDLEYHNNKGVRRNNDLESIEWYSTIKQQITPQDTLLALVKYEDYHSGDNFHYYDPSHSLRPNFRFDVYEHPIVVGGWHHEWTPGIHTLLLGGELSSEQLVRDRAAPSLFLLEDTAGTIYANDSVPLDFTYHNRFEIYTAEANQIMQWNRVTISAGARYQAGTFQTHALFENPPQNLAILFDSPVANSNIVENFGRVTGYTYLTLQPLDRLWLTEGLVYDDISYPSNLRNPPLSSGHEHQAQFGPKSALVWNPLTSVTVRGIYTRSLGGVSLDESYRLEPTQLAGFPQAFPTIIPESIVGSVSAPRYQTFGAALDLKFPTGTYFGLEAQRIESSVDRTIGLFSRRDGPLSQHFAADSTREKLDFSEESLRLTAYQLLPAGFVMGASYQLASVRLHDLLPDVPVGAVPNADLTERAQLHQVSGYLAFNHASGFFARAEAHWYHQHNSGYPIPLKDSDFFQENLFAGWRLFHRRAEITLGLLNLAGRDYRLNPLTAYSELARKRTFEARLKFEF